MWMVLCMNHVNLLVNQRKKIYILRIEYDRKRIFLRDLRKVLNRIKIK